ncbi:hypothetical protein AB0D90_03490 [Streptomyces althioticus]|uniref:hypothetical protein n=1 Tax=Streptomyces althioticus TaxID=83380 RepID=UPI0033E682E0
MTSHDVRSGHAHDEPGTTVSRHGVITRVTCEDGFFVIAQTTNDVTTSTGPEDTDR